MYFYTADMKKVNLKPLALRDFADDVSYGVGFRVSGREYSSRAAHQVTQAARSIFEMTSAREGRMAVSTKVEPAAFEDTASGLLRVVYKEIMIRFRSRVRAKDRDKILRKHGFMVRSRSRYARNQYVVKDKTGRKIGGDLLEIANDWAEMDEVVFAAPNFVSEYRRVATPRINPEQWHLLNRGEYVDQVTDEDVNARGAWRKTLGRPSVVVAILDDGVDVDHPNLRSRILKRPDPDEPQDLCGRDFFVPETHPEHYNPRPKLFQFPFEQMAGNDIHGTPCAGVAAAAGSIGHVNGVAPKCRILPVKIFHADALASDARVADAIRYAASIADVLSCSWTGAPSPDVDFAIEDAAADRDGKGVPIFCAAGNGGGDNSVGYPASHPETIAVGASTDQAQLADYSDTGPEISVVAPSSGGVLSIYTTDVSYPNRGFNVGVEEAGGADGLHTNDFGGTSSATPLAAGVAALTITANPNLTRAEVREVLERTATQIGQGYDANGHSNEFGYGRVDAEAAVKEALKLGASP